VKRPIVAVCIAFASACANRAPARPTGTPTPDASAIEAFTAATRPCAGLKTVTAALRLSGRAGGERMRGTLHAGLAAPAAIRFEAVAPFGQPFFILAGTDNRATLLLPRDRRILADAAVPDLLERLIGVRLTASDLRHVITGCLADSPQPADGRAWSRGWRAVTLPGEITAYLREVAGATVVAAADFGRWRVDYRDHQGGFPRGVRIRSVDGESVDLSAAIDQLQTNVAIERRAFAVDAPPDAETMTIDQLRSVAPLRGAS
jgi:hypothetical protein